MKLLLKVRNLPPSDRHLLISALLLLAVIRLGLSLLTFQTLRRILTKVMRKPTGFQSVDNSFSNRIAWAVTVGSRYIPGTNTCLAQALATHMLLAWRGYPAHLRIGVVRGQGGQLQAHAWVESQGKIVIGRTENLSRYTLLRRPKEKDRERDRWDILPS